MNEGNTLYKSIKSVKDPLFDLNELNNYQLSIQIGEAELQACATDTNSGRCLLLEDYLIKKTDNLDQLVGIIVMLIDQHEVLSAGYWKTIRLIVKSNLHTIVPDEYFNPDELASYLHPIGDLDEQSDQLFHIKHDTGNFHSIFGVPAKLVYSIKNLYKRKEVQILHQSIPIIEGIYRYNDHTDIKNMFLFADHKLVYVIVFDRKELSFFNSYHYEKPEEFVKFVLGVFQQKRMNQQYAKLVIWGSINTFSPQFKTLKKYIKKIELGERPSFLRFRDEFDDLEPHTFYDLYNSFIC